MDGPLRQVTVRIEHDCPLARLSRAVPQAELQCWSGHTLEVVEVRVPDTAWAGFEAAAIRLLKPLRLLRLRGGGVIVWEPHVEAERSLSRTLEAHRFIWMQPVRVKAGWESYDAVAFGPAGRGPHPEQAALDELARRWPTQVTRRRTVEPQTVLASLFLSMAHTLDAPTDKQAEALQAAASAGYYNAPRQATTADVAATMGIGRSAFEERLRGAENRILGGLAPLLEAHRKTEGMGQTAKRRRRVAPAWSSASARKRA
ncbi:MAG: helix-turn-helix domain-containing protein [Candidatus Thermoplasmatota archaeon]